MHISFLRAIIASGTIAFVRISGTGSESLSAGTRHRIRFVRAELKKMGFLLNAQKTQIQRPGQQQTATGIVVNEKLSIPTDYRRKLRQELYYCRKFGIQEHLQKTDLEIPEETYRMQLLGRVNYVLYVHPDDKDMLEARKWLEEFNTK